jgi:hypothetical protein
MGRGRALYADSRRFGTGGKSSMPAFRSAASIQAAARSALSEAEEEADPGFDVARGWVAAFVVEREPGLGVEALAVAWRAGMVG